MRNWIKIDKMLIIGLILISLAINPSNIQKWL